MKGWQRWLTFTLAMLLAWTPLCASHAQETTDSFCLRMALTVETDAASEAMHAWACTWTRRSNVPWMP